MAPEEEDDRRNKEEEYTSHDTDKFNHADADGDGKLSKEEYPAFLYPEHHDFMADHVTGVCMCVLVFVCMCVACVLMCE